MWHGIPDPHDSREIKDHCSQPNKWARILYEQGYFADSEREGGGFSGLADMRGLMKKIVLDQDGKCEGEVTTLVDCRIVF